MRWYVYEHQHSGLNIVTPHRVYSRDYIEVMGKRKEVYGLAKSKHPKRWSGLTRDCSHQTVALNPMKDQSEKTSKLAV